MSLVPKSDAASPDNPARYPKRKRKAVSYAEQQQDDESSKEESASELSDDGIEWGVRKRVSIAFVAVILSRQSSCDVVANIADSLF